MDGSDDQAGVKVCPSCGSDRDWRGLCPSCVLTEMLVLPEILEPEESLPAHDFDGRFQIRQELGSGGAGRVWRAQQRELGREVAIKTLRNAGFSDAISRRRLRREAQVVSRLRHPGIVALYEIGEAGGEPFLVMELVRGETLAQRLREGPLAPTWAARIVRDLAGAVQHAHEQGVIHRDLKPSNVMLDADRQEAPRLTDFGIARVLDQHTALTAHREGLGTASYLAPEQALGRGKLQGPATDVYGLGAVLFHCLTGRAPFVGASAAEVIRAVVEEDPTAPRILNPTLPRELETIGLRCLEKDPRNRYPTAAAVQEDLERWLDGRPILARPIGGVERAWRGCRRRPALSLACAAAVGLLAGLALVREHGRRQLAQTVTQLELQRAESFFQDGQISDGMAQLAWTARRDAASPVVRARLWSALHHRPWIRPLGSLNEGTNLVLRFAADARGEWVLWSPFYGQLEVRQAASWEALGSPRTIAAYLIQGGLTADAQVAFALDARGRLSLWEPRDNRDLPTPVLPAVHAVSLSEHPGQIAAAGEDGVVRLFIPGATNSTEFRHGPELHQLHLAPPADRLVSWGRDGRWVLWDTISRNPLAEGRISRPVSLELAQLSPTSRWLVVAAGDGTLELLDARDGRREGGQRIEGRITGVAFAASSERLLVAGTGGGVQLLDLANGGRLISQWPSPTVVAALAPSPGGDLALACTVQGQWRVWDLKAARPVSEWFAHGHGSRGAAFINQRRELLTLSRENELRHWRLAPLAPFQDFSVPATNFHNDYSAERIAFRSNECVVAARGPHVVRASLDGSAVKTQPLAESPGRLVERVTLRSNDLLTWSPLYPDADVWDFSTGTHLQALDSGGQRVSAAGWLPQERAVLLATADGRVQMQFLDGERKPVDLAPTRFREIPREVNPDGSWADNNLRHGEQHRFSQLAVSPDGRWLAAVGTDHAIHGWDLRSNTLAWDPIHFAYIVTGVSWAPDSRTFAVATWAYYAQLFSAATGAPVGPPLMHKDGVSHVAFSPDGSRLVTASLDGTARIWDRRTQRPIGQPLAHDADVVMADFSPDQRWVLTASSDGTARVWHAATGAPASESLSVLGAPERSLRDLVQEARFTPDGRRIVLLHRSGQVAVFDWEIPAQPVPTWMTEIVESLGGQRLGEAGISESAPGLSPSPRFPIRAGTSGWSRWLERFYGDASP